MIKKGAKEKPRYKQMAFETAVRNPERYLGILLALRKFENKILDDNCLLEIVSHLYFIGKVSSEKIKITNSTTAENIKDDVIKVNSTRRADGGFPMGYASRFWTYVRTLSELGFVYAQYKEPFRFSEVAEKLMNSEIDEQEAFSIQAMKYNRRSPYRNVSNDFNFFRLILKILLSLREAGKRLSYEQFIVLTFSQESDPQNFLDLISKNKFKDYESTYKFIKKTYKNVNKIKTVTRDYPDVVRRILIISGFITIRYEGKKFIQLNENRLDYIKELLEVNFGLTEEEKNDAGKYFEKLSSLNEQYFKIIEKYRKQDVLVGEKYTNKIFEIIKSYKIDEDKIIESIEQIGTRKSVIPEFKEIPEPLKLEFFIAILIALKYKDKFYIRPNYKADHVGKPYSHAPGNVGDIDVYSPKTYWLIEVTLIRNKNQQLNNETTSVIRHLNSSEEFKKYSTKYLSFVAPVIHQDTKKFLDYMLVMNQTEKTAVSIKPYNIKNFIKVTMKEDNLNDMGNYTKNMFKQFKAKLS